jgi:hypothetical protein
MAETPTPNSGVPYIWRWIGAAGVVAVLIRPSSNFLFLVTFSLRGPRLLKEDQMNKYVFVSDSGDDKNDGLEENRPVKTTSRAIKISLKTGREIRVLDYQGRPGNEVQQLRKAS